MEMHFLKVRAYRSLCTHIFRFPLLIVSLSVLGFLYEAGTLTPTDPVCYSCFRTVIPQTKSYWRVEAWIRCNLILTARRMALILTCWILGLLSPAHLGFWNRQFLYMPSLLAPCFVGDTVVSLLSSFYLLERTHDESLEPSAHTPTPWMIRYYIHYRSMGSAYHYLLYIPISVPTGAIGGWRTLARALSFSGRGSDGLADSWACARRDVLCTLQP